MDDIDYDKNRAEWSKALRSGDYEQTKGSLFDGKGYCCLGVAAVCAGITLPPLAQNPGVKFDPDLYMSHSDAYRVVQQWLGLTNEMGSYYVEEVYFSLVRYNDNGNDFNFIADVIDSKPDGLFID